MRNSAPIKFSAYLLLVILSVLPVSCVLDDEPQSANGPTETVFSINIPVSPNTRGLSEDDEYKVSTVDVIVFNHATQEALYKVNSVNLITQTGNTIKFKVKLRKVENVSSYDFVVLANTRYIYPGDIIPGTLKSSIQGTVTDNVNSGSGWISDKTRASYRHTPMWGEMSDQAIEEKEYESSLTRMTARVDINVALTTQDTFLLEEIWLCNYNTTGYIIPESQYWNNTTKYVTSPSVNNLTMTTGTTDGIDYSGYISSDKKSLTSTIYTFEAAKGTDASYTATMCFLVKGTWTPSGGSAQTGWYRVDMASMQLADFKITYLPVLRNHAYLMTILSVSGPGYGTKEQAYNSMPVHIINTIQGWKDGELSSIYTDGPYMMGVSQTEYNLTRELRDNTDIDNLLKVTTNHADGWTAKIWADEAGTTTNGTTWLTLSAYGGTGNYSEGDDVVMNMIRNTGTSARTAWIHVKAGRMTAKIKVVQTAIDFNYIISTSGFKSGTLGANRIEALVKSNAPWRLTGVSGDTGILESCSHAVGTGGNGNADGETFWYKFKDSAQDGTVTFTFQLYVKGVAVSGKTAAGTAKVTIAGWFARSNVVMKDKGFTFAVTENDNVLIPASVQGLIFRFGSMVGVGGVRNSDGGRYYIASLARIWPFGTTDNYTNDNWNSSSAGVPYHSSLTDVADQFSGYGGGNGYYTLTSGNSSTNRNKGDICRWISDQADWVSAGKGSWRMPTQAEYELLRTQTTPVRTSASFITDTANPLGLPKNQPADEGRFALPHGYWFGINLSDIDSAKESPRVSPPVGSVFFPASGYRLATSGTTAAIGMLEHTGISGYYWSATNSTSNPYGFVFNNTSTNTGRTMAAGTGMPIRCIRVSVP